MSSKNKKNIQAQLIFPENFQLIKPSIFLSVVAVIVLIFSCGAFIFSGLADIGYVILIFCAIWYLPQFSKFIKVEGTDIYYGNLFVHKKCEFNDIKYIEQDIFRYGEHDIPNEIEYKIIGKNGKKIFDFSENNHYCKVFLARAARLGISIREGKGWDYREARSIRSHKKLK